MSNKKVFIIFIFLSTLYLYARDDQLLTLSRVYEKALERESQILAYRYTTEAAEEGVNQAFAQFLPQIKLDASLGHNKYRYAGPEVSESYKDYGISAYIPVFHPEIYIGLDQAKDRRDSAKYEFQRNANQLGLEVAKAYFNLIRTQKNLVYARSLLEANEIKYKQMSSMLQVGLSNKIDTLEARVAFEHSKAELLAEEKRYNVAKMTLEYMIGEKITSSRLIDISLEEINPDALVIAAYDWQKGLENNIDVKLAEKNLASAQKDLAIRRWEHFPVADFQLVQKKTDSQDPALRENDFRALFVVSLPLYQGGRTQSRIREGMKLQSAAIENLNHYRKQANLRLESYLAEQKLAIESLKILKETEYSMRLHLSSVEQGYERGLRNLFDVLEARSRLYETRRNIIDSLYDLIVNQLNLLDVTGTLNVDRIYEIERKINILGRSTQ